MQMLDNINKTVKEGLLINCSKAAVVGEGERGAGGEDSQGAAV